MLAKKLSHSDSELPTRPFNVRPTPSDEGFPTSSTHIMLVRAPGPTLRSLAWARGKQQTDTGYDATRLESMLRLERLNLG